MLDCIEVYMLTFHGVRTICPNTLVSLILDEQMNIYRSLHLCSSGCVSHVQPSFQSLVDAARDALQNLFSPVEGLLGCVRDIPSTYPTQEQLFHARIIGLTQFKLYFSYLLLTKEEKTEVRDRLSLPPVLIHICVLA